MTKAIIALAILGIGIIGVFLSIIWGGVITIKMMKFAIVLNEPMIGSDLKISEFISVSCGELTEQQRDFLNSKGIDEYNELRSNLLKCASLILSSSALILISSNL